MNTVLLVILIISVAADLGLGVGALSDFEAAHAPGGAIKLIALQSDIWMLGGSLTLTAITTLGLSVIRLLGDILEAQRDLPKSIARLSPVERGAPLRYTTEQASQAASQQEDKKGVDGVVRRRPLTDWGQVER